MSDQLNASRPERKISRIVLRLGWEGCMDHKYETKYTFESFGEEMDTASLKITHLTVRWGEIWSEFVPDGA